MKLMFKKRSKKEKQKTKFKRGKIYVLKLIILFYKYNIIKNVNKYFNK